MNLAETATLFTTSLEPRCSELQRTRTLHLMRESGHIPPELALRIYGNNVSGALIKALTAAYPACHRILGEECFKSTAYQFIEHTPSEQPDLYHYGANFSEILDNWTATRKQFSDYRYLGDLARLEWLCHMAYYAEDNMPFDFKTFAEASHNAQETLRFRLGHDLGLLQSEYPVMAIREVNLSDGDASEIHTDELPEYLVISRPTYQPHVDRVDEITFKLLAACEEGKTLGNIVDTGKHQAKMIAKILPGLIERGWITGVSMGSSCTPGDP